MSSRTVSHFNEQAQAWRDAKNKDKGDELLCDLIAATYECAAAQLQAQVDLRDRMDTLEQRIERMESPYVEVHAPDVTVTDIGLGDLGRTVDQMRSDICAGLELLIDSVKMLEMGQD